MLPQLLVSVRDRLEFELAVSCNVGWVDLKNPDNGSLGRPDSEVIQQALQIIRTSQFRPYRTSLALGELIDLNISSVEPEAAEFDFAKVAFAGYGDASEFSKISRLAKCFRATCQLILVHYADGELVGAPSFRSIQKWACDLGCQYILIDTCRKSSGNLLDWYSIEALRELIAQVHEAGIAISLAGSLGPSDLVRLARLNPDVLAVRGAACTVGQRTNGLCENRLRQLVQLERVGFADQESCKMESR